MVGGRLFGGGREMELCVCACVCVCVCVGGLMGGDRLGGGRWWRWEGIDWEGGGGDEKR